MGDSQQMTPATLHILLALAGEDMHGYAIIQQVKADTEDEVKLTASTLYAAVKRLQDYGWIEEVARRPNGDDDPRRRYYHLAAAGRSAVRAELRRLERLAQLAREKRLLPEPRNA
jgi:DNA-binding PadR family transcriptional regulator